MRGSPGGQGRSPVSPNDGYGFSAQSQNTSPPYGASPYGQTGYDRGPSPSQNQNISPASYGQNSFDRRPSPAVSYSQYSQGSDQYERRAQQAPYVAPLQPYNMDEAPTNPTCHPLLHQTATTPPLRLATTQTHRAILIHMPMPLLQSSHTTSQTVVRPGTGTEDMGMVVAMQGTTLCRTEVRRRRRQHTRGSRRIRRSRLEASRQV
jgi:hypothetical protein